ncbi:MAG: hypothetical protein GXP00_00040 [Alphaproteobacteria bacterium]|nr:hypothetical protein [Alphaproteobacteria bacterium]
MPDTTLTIKNSVKANTPHRPAFFDPGTLPWADWVMPGTYFKLLNINELTGGFTMLLKVDPDVTAPVHHHIGGIEAYVVEGEFGYGEDDRGGVGSYVLEAGGSIHEPSSPEGVIMFAVVHGPLVGYNEDGSIAAVIDGRFMYDLAGQNNVADHITVTNTFTNND